jgi:hypothetical protein
MMNAAMTTVLLGYVLDSFLADALRVLVGVLAG